MYSTVIVPLDGSTFAERAIPVAAAVASRTGARLVLVRVHDTAPHVAFQSPEWSEYMRGDEEAYVERYAAHLVGSQSLNADWRVLDGAPAPALATFAEQASAPLIVMSTHGRTGIPRSWLGSIADGVLHGTSAPVLLIRPERGGGRSGIADELSTFATILVALDGSLVAERAVPHAVDLAEIFRAALLLFRVSTVRDSGPRQYLRGLGARCRSNHPDLDVEAEVHYGNDPSAAILARASDLDRPLIVLGSHGRGLSRYVFGSVADDVLRGAPRAMAIVRSHVGPLPVRRRQQPATTSGELRQF